MFSGKTSMGSAAVASASRFASRTAVPIYSQIRQAIGRTFIFSGTAGRTGCSAALAFTGAGHGVSRTLTAVIAGLYA